MQCRRGRRSGTAKFCHADQPVPPCGSPRKGPPRVRPLAGRRFSGASQWCTWSGESRSRCGRFRIGSGKARPQIVRRVRLCGNPGRRRTSPYIRFPFQRECDICRIPPLRAFPARDISTWRAPSRRIETVSNRPLCDTPRIRLSVAGLQIARRADPVCDTPRRVRTESAF